MDFNVMQILLDCGIILFATKAMGMLTRKLGLPQVAGMIIAGLLIGPALFLHTSFPGLIHPTETEMAVLKSFSQIGVVFILFSSGLETDFREMKRSGVAATCIALAGVLLPIAAGTAVALLFMGGFGEIQNHEKLMNALFVGCILSATSVGITVETLRELGKLKTKIGTTILSAAIIDDVIGIIALSMITGLGGDGSISKTLLHILGFFAFTAAAGFVLRKAFQLLVRIYPHKRRTSIFAFSACFIFAYCAETFFGIAAITGAYMAGLMLSGLGDSQFVDRKVVVSGYMFFTPMFFAYIGISADFSAFRLSSMWFVLAFVAVGILGKILGCTAAARCFRYSRRESLAAGFGMIARGEVALAVYATGQSLIAPQGGIDPLVATIFLIITSSILCPILLKLVFRHHQSADITANSPHSVTISSEAIENVHHDLDTEADEPDELHQNDENAKKACSKTN
ncbi:MAG: cation:proton antiporter [Oscillospiraceae bacterium]|nr:cation:proton antiporter [Oscillospiraceae bacterium]